MEDGFEKPATLGIGFDKLHFQPVTKLHQFIYLDDDPKLFTEGRHSDRPFRVLIIAGSDRRQYNCPGVDSKARALMYRMGDQFPQDWEIDMEDLGNVFGRPKIQSCNAATLVSPPQWPCASGPAIVTKRIPRVSLT